MLDQRLHRAAEGVREALADVSPPDLDLTGSESRPAADRRIRPEWRPVLVAVGAFISVLVVFGVLPLLLPPSNSTTVTSAGSEASEMIPLGENPGLTGSDGMLWAWDRDGHILGYVDGSWIEIPSLSDPIIDVAGTTPTAAWSITTNRCDPTLPDWEKDGCETTLWHLVDGAWEPHPELGGMQLPDDLEDLEFDSDGTLWIVSASGALYTWDGTETATAIGAGLLHNDGIAITGDGTVWASRFNPYFPEDVGFARRDRELGTWQPFSPLDGENHHAVMTTTPNGDLWVWFSELSPTASPSRTALAFYNSAVGDWTIHDSNLPAASIRAITASNDAVWLTGASDDLARIWRFDGEAWTPLLTARPGAEIEDVAAAPDGTVWYVEDNILYELQP